jgi:hypothetical protein
MARPPTTDDGIRVTVYLPQAVKDQGAARAAKSGMSFSRYVTHLLTSGPAFLADVPYTKIGDHWVPAPLIPPFYAGKASATAATAAFTFKGASYPAGAVVLWWPTDARPGDVVLTSKGKVVEITTEEPIPAKEVKGVVFAALRTT